MLRQKRINRVDDVAAWRLCMGCGACRWACPNGAVALRNITDEGIRPFVHESRCESCGRCLEVCPGISLEHSEFPENVLQGLAMAWGPVLEVWEGFASDPEIRYAGSSGGVATALALCGLERRQCVGILHSRWDPDDPLANVPVLSRTRSDLLLGTGSRYGPSAPCQALDRIKSSSNPCFFVGKPCDVAALCKAQMLDGELARTVALTVSIFCAATPTRQGTLDLLDAMGIDDSSHVESLRYRGNGWPGVTTIQVKAGIKHTMTYEQAWGKILSKHSQSRCRLCPDGTGEFADISCGDPWCRPLQPAEPGSSLVLVRSERGRRFLAAALESGYVELREASPEILSLSQQSLLAHRRHLWGRLWTMRTLGCEIPRYEGFQLRSNWQRLSARERLRCVAGTVRRIIFRRWFKPTSLRQERP